MPKYQTWELLSTYEENLGPMALSAAEYQLRLRCRHALQHEGAALNPAALRGTYQLWLLDFEIKFQDLTKGILGAVRFYNSKLVPNLLKAC